MAMLALEDMKNMTEEQVKEHLANEYAPMGAGADCAYPSNADKAVVLSLLKDYTILVAYESVGDYGCDSSSFFLLRKKKTKELFIIQGSHCSCYGFEGQFDLEPTTVGVLKKMDFKYFLGGYDSNSGNADIMRAKVEKMRD